jgi:hypothetical protein
MPMRIIVAFLLVCCFMSSGAFALSSECWRARSLGGPCGCVASEHIFGHSVRDLWKASSWYRFPRTSPHPGAVAIWGARHVEAVVAVSASTVTTDGPYGLRQTPIGRLVFVDPRSGPSVEVHLAGRHDRHHYASRHYRHYASEWDENREAVADIGPERRW